MTKIKNEINDLSIFGGTALFDTPLYVGRPNVAKREKFMERVNDILDKRWLSNGGKYLNEFEKAISNYIGVKYCVVVTNATIALEIAVRALDLKGEVILPSFTFIASAHALQWLGVKPVFCDIDPQTYNIDSAKVEKLITQQTCAILGVHVYGRPCDCDALKFIADKYNLTLMYDAAHAFGCTYKGRMVGHFGELEVFSFHATKFLNSLEGGAIVTNNEELAKRVRSMMNFGFTNYDRVDTIGTNGKMNEVSAAMGLTNIECVDELIENNKRNYKQYQIELNGIEGIQLISFDENEKHNYQYIVIDIDESKTGISRDSLTKILHAENVLARRYFYPGCHRLEPYYSQNPQIGKQLPVTEQVTGRVLCYPTGNEVDFNDISRICNLTHFIVSHGNDISKRMCF